MVELNNAQIDAALQRGVAATGEPRAAAARYEAGKIVVALTNGCSFSFPPALVQGLENASSAQLGRVQILGKGYGLHWEDLDVDLSVPGLLNGIFGTRAHMARLAGQAKTPAKAAAARANGAKGGRPLPVQNGFWRSLKLSVLSWRLRNRWQWKHSYQPA